MNKPESVQKNDTHKILWGFEMQTDRQIPARRPDPVLIKKKYSTCHLVDFAIPVDQRLKIKESENINKYLDLTRKLKKQWNMKVTVIPIVVGALGTVPKGLEKKVEKLKIKGRIETIQSIALLILARILRRVQETRGDLLSIFTQPHRSGRIWHKVNF